jgi:type IV pilus assembly protein PilB
MIKNVDFLRMAVTARLLSEDDARKLSIRYGGNDFAVLMHLVNGRAARKEVLGKLWGDSLGLAYVDLTKTIFQSALTQLLPVEFARKHTAIPDYQFGDTITLAAVNPTNRQTIKEAEAILGKPVSTVFSFAEDIEDAIAVQYQSSTALGNTLEKIAANTLFTSSSKIDNEQLQQFAGDQSIIQFTRGVILLAVKERASDIHIEPAEDLVRIRFRIDGVLQERLKLDLALLPPLISRLKVMASLDITERRRPQDGRISLPLTNRSIDIRFSSLPTIYGEKIVMRILGMADLKEIPDLKSLYFSRRNLDTMLRLVERPNGVFFVTVPPDRARRPPCTRPSIRSTGPGSTS